MILTSESVGLTFKDTSGNLINIFKACHTCCSGIRYFGCIENDPNDNFYAYNSQGMRLDHKGRAISEGSLILE